MKQKHIVSEAFNDTRHVTLFRCHREFNTWYEMECFVMKKPDSVADSFTYSREYWNVDSALSNFDKQVQLFNLKEE